MNSTIKLLLKKVLLPITLLSSVASTHAADCIDNVVLVHGNSGSPSDWNNTYDELIAGGYSSSQIFTPSWGYSSAFYASYNNHSGFEETPVRNAINNAISQSCTGKIDVIGHSMGVTLAAKQIINENKVNKIDTFVGIAGAYRGLWTCGTYPWNVWTPTCGRDGLSVSSPLLDWLYGKKLADRVYSIKSWSDQIVCATGVCLVGGVHSSQIKNENDSFTYAYGHFGLQKYTYSKQVDLIQ